MVKYPLSLFCSDTILLSVKTHFCNNLVKIQPSVSVGVEKEENLATCKWFENMKYVKHKHDHDNISSWTVSVKLIHYWSSLLLNIPGIGISILLSGFLGIQIRNGLNKDGLEWVYDAREILVNMSLWKYWDVWLNN